MLAAEGEEATPQRWGRNTASTTASSSRCRTCTASSAPARQRGVERVAADPCDRRRAVGRSADGRAVLVSRRGSEAEPASCHRNADDRFLRRGGGGTGRAPFGVGASRARGGFPIIRVEALSEPLVREHLQSLLGEENISDELVALDPVGVGRIAADRPSRGRLSHRSRLSVLAGGWLGRGDGPHRGVAHSRWRGVDPDGESRSACAGASCGDRGGGGVRRVLGRRSAGERRRFVAGGRIFRALREVVALGLLDESNDGKTITFPQIHLREAVYNAMTERRRTELHQRAAAALEAALMAGSTHLLGEVAFHYARANDRSKGVRYSVEAGDLAMRTIAHRGSDGVLSQRARTDGPGRRGRSEKGRGAREARRCLLPQQRLPRGDARVSVPAEEHSGTQQRRCAERRSRPRHEEDRQGARPSAASRKRRCRTSRTRSINSKRSADRSMSPSC